MMLVYRMSPLTSFKFCHNASDATSVSHYMLLRIAHCLCVLTRIPITFTVDLLEALQTSGRGDGGIPTQAATLVSPLPDEGREAQQLIDDCRVGKDPQGCGHARSCNFSAACTLPKPSCEMRAGAGID